ncbi:MAG: hypothetical protein ACR2IS_12285 [Nitrososphaeraceae archaeon]
MRRKVKSIGSLIPFIIIILVAGWFVYTRPAPPDVEQSKSANSQPRELKEPIDTIFTCRNAAQRELRTVDTLGNITSEEANRNAKVLTSCDKQMLFYRDQCQEDPSESYCADPALKGYFLVRNT